MKSRVLAHRATVSLVLCIAMVTVVRAQQGKAAEAPPSGMSADQAIALAGQGRCREALPVLRKTVIGGASKEQRKNAGVAGVRCALAVDDRLAAGEFLGQLNKQFPRDPDVLYVLVHAYSDLSSRSAADLGQNAAQSVEARKLNAESLEIQGKWDDAVKQYEEILATAPNQSGIHYLIGRALLSKPEPDDARLAAAKQEFVKELEINPKNPGAEYILGEMARQSSDWEEAIQRFSRAAKLDAGFGDAFWGWGFALLSAKRYEEAIPPLQTAVKLQPGNPSAHYNLAMALSRTGHKQEADKEFAIQKQLVAKLDAERNAQVQSGKPQ